MDMDTVTVTDFARDNGIECRRENSVGRIIRKKAKKKIKRKKLTHNGVKYYDK